MVKYTQAYLKKLEDLLKEGKYDVRYERGNFKSGYCILEDKRVVVINKFSTLESRIQALVEIIQGLSASGHLNNDLRHAVSKNPIQGPGEEDVLPESDAAINEIDNSDLSESQTLTEE
jgi:hypothetical protein